MNPLPAEKLMNGTADWRPCIVVHTREQCLLVFGRLPLAVGTLTICDYSVLGA